MKIVKNLSEISEIVSDLYKSQKKINLIPTMGNIHPGHLSLITEANKFEGINLVSIFINPAQFNDIDDFKNYPKTFEKDLEILSKTSCKIIFAPKINGYLLFMTLLSFKRLAIPFNPDPFGIIRTLSAFNSPRLLNSEYIYPPKINNPTVSSIARKDTALTAKHIFRLIRSWKIQGMHWFHQTQTN